MKVDVQMLLCCSQARVLRLGPLEDWFCTYWVQVVLTPPEAPKSSIEILIRPVRKSTKRIKEPNMTTAGMSCRFETRPIIRSTNKTPSEPTAIQYGIYLSIQA